MHRRVAPRLLACSRRRPNRVYLVEAKAGGVPRRIVAQYGTQLGGVAAGHVYQRCQSGPEMRQSGVRVHDGCRGLAVGRAGGGGGGRRGDTHRTRLLVGLAQPVGRFEQRHHSRFASLQFRVQLL